MKIMFGRITNNSEPASSSTPYAVDFRAKEFSRGGYKLKILELTTERLKLAANLPRTGVTLIFMYKTTDTAGFEDGFIPWASLEKPERDIPELKDAEETLISQKTVTILIDYPLRNEYKFELNSETGFTREFLLKEISKAYYKIYEDEEATATVKTIPIEKRTTMYNRNETNGKYGIWGHDIADLVLAEIQVYETSGKKLVLVLVVNS